MKPTTKLALAVFCYFVATVVAAVLAGWGRWRAAFSALKADTVVIDALDWRDVRKRQWDTAFLNVKVVRGKKFVNERVVMDGQRFIECVFENVTLVFKGDAPFEIINCKAEGTNVMDTHNDPALRSMFELARMTGFFHDEVLIHDGDQRPFLTGNTRSEKPTHNG